jgi:SynChlorMet cassette radical SAM/SPASM protein ScmE
MTKLMPTPRSVDLEITSRCNARCRYCYYLNNEGVTYEDLPAEKWLDFFRELGRAKVMYVCVAGGEPFVRRDIFDLFEGIKENRMRFQVLTNGRLVTRDVARRLRETGRIYSIQVSLDGSTAEIHESLRGRGSFEPALRAIRFLTEEGLPLTVRVTVHAGNIDDLPAVARLLLEEYRLPSFSTNTVSALGTKSKYDDGIFLSPVQRLKAMKTLAELDERYPGRILADAGPLAEWKMFQEMERARAKGRAIPGRGFLVGCGCVFQRLSVRSDGAYVPCVMLPQVVLGWIGRDRIEDIWLHSPVLRSMRERRDRRLSSFAECQGCEYAGSCTGNCPGTAYSLLGDIDRPSPEGCLRKFKRDLASEGVTL